jgi:hypothetical protein
MDPTAFSLALGILAFDFCFAILGAPWTVSLVAAMGTTIAIWQGQRIVRCTSLQNARSS